MKKILFLLLAICFFLPEYAEAKAVKLGRGQSGGIGNGATINTGTAVASCPDGYYWQDENYGCVPCAKRYGLCTKCTKTVCTGCPDGYSLKNGVCEKDCGDGYYYQDENYGCVPCAKRYGLCTQCTKLTCTGCPEGYKIQNGVCVSICSENEFYQDGYGCLTCGKKFGICTTCTADACTGCPEGYTLNNGVCEPLSCATSVLEQNSDVAVASDAASLQTALSSGKGIILVDSNFTASSSLDLNARKLVGPKYFSSISTCSSATTPTLSFGSSDTMTMTNSEINHLNVTFAVSDKSKDAINGTGTIQDSTITAKLVKNVVATAGKITLAGDVTLISQTDDGDNMVNQSILDAQDNSNVNITGKTTLKGASDRGLNIATKGTVTVAASGSLVLNIPDCFIGIDLDGKFTANGPVKFEVPASSAIGYISLNNPSITMNASGNIIKATYSGFMQTSGSIVINGATTIELSQKSGDNSNRKAIKSSETYSSSVSSVTIKAPVTVKGLTEKHNASYPNSTGDELLSMVGGTLNISSTLESTTGIGKVLINGASMSMGTSGAILGASYMYGKGKNMSVSTGAKLKLGGTCKKATTTGTLSTVTYDSGIASPVSPFTGGC